MKELENDDTISAYRTKVMKFLNEYGLDATAILSMVRRTQPVRFEPGENVLIQGLHDHHIYFLVGGTITIAIKAHDRVEVLGERQGPMLLGEISYFNGTPATATIRVKEDAPAIFLRLSYDEFSAVLNEFPNIRPTLTRIGDMRVISQKDGFSSFEFYMDVIGWKRDRLALNRALLPHLDYTINQVLLPRLDAGDNLLEVGDGPGVICEQIHEDKPQLLENLFMQVAHLEDAIISPLQPYPSDFSRAAYLKERFQAIVALEVFTQVAPHAVGEQFRLAAQLMVPNGLLLILRLKLLDTSGRARQDAELISNEMEALVERSWPGVLAKEPLVSVSFTDADLDPLMEWNVGLRRSAVAGALEVSENLNELERTMLEVLLRQARQHMFNPEELQFQWIAKHALQHGFRLESEMQNPEVGFFYQLHTLTAEGK